MKVTKGLAVMARSNQFILLLPLVLALGISALMLTALADEAGWGYEGETGPAHWAELSPDFALCEEGAAQSPIDIAGSSELDLVDIDFQYGATANHIFNNGHTIQVNVDAGSRIVYNGLTYHLLQFHFHLPSEHTLDGAAAAMEIHFVHQDANSGNLAVIGVMLNEGAHNDAYAAVFDNLPAEVGEPMPAGDDIALDALLPESRAFYTYQGSLTTPPCSEIVRWLVLDAPLQLSTEQIAAFAAIHAGNARPTLPLGARDLLHDAG